MGLQGKVLATVSVQKNAMFREMFEGGGCISAARNRCKYVTRAMFARPVLDGKGRLQVHCQGRDGSEVSRGQQKHAATISREVPLQACECSDVRADIGGVSASGA